MNSRSLALFSRAYGTWCAFATILYLLVGAQLASAQPTVANVKTAWTEYNNHFACQDSNGHDIFAAVSGTCSRSGFWVQAELIEMSVDAYQWAKTNDSSNLTSYSNEVNSLINGFADAYGITWTSDLYDDDVLWAVLAFGRAGHEVGNNNWMTDAENNFQAVYSRGRASNGGIYWNAGCESGCSSWYENSAANWTFALAGYLLAAYSGNSTYKTEANGVLTWATANLYNSTTGEIYDGVNSSSTNTGQYSYNYGVAIGAGTLGSAPTLVTNVSNYLMNDLPNYAGTVGGYNILPNYGQGNQDGSGFNGITMRWVGYANDWGDISSTVLAWAQANLNQAYSEMNTSTGLIWNDWASPTSGTEYCWDESDAIVGFFTVSNP